MTNKFRSSIEKYLSNINKKGKETSSDILKEYKNIISESEGFSEKLSSYSFAFVGIPAGYTLGYMFGAMKGAFGMKPKEQDSDLEMILSEINQNLKKDFTNKVSKVSRDHGPIDNDYLIGGNK